MDNKLTYSELEKENKILRKEVKENEDYRMFFNKTINGVSVSEIIYDKNGKPDDLRIIDANPAFEKYINKNIGDLTGKTFKEIIPDIKDGVINIYLEVAISGKTRKFQNNNYNLKLFSLSKNKLGIIVEDISELKKQELRYKGLNEEYLAINEELTSSNEEIRAVNEEILYKNEKIEKSKILVEKSKEKFDEIFRYMSSGCAIYSAVENGDDFVFADFNKAAEKIESVKKEQLIGVKVTKAFPGIEKFGLLDVFKRVYRTSVPEHFPVSFYEDNKLQGWRDNYVYKLSSGEIIVMYEDVTERKKAEQEIKKLSTAIEQSANTVVITDTEGNIEYTNPKFYELTGYTQEEALGKNPNILNSGELPKEYYANLWKTIKAGKVGKGEFHNIKKDGTFFWEQAIISPVKNDKGKIINYIAVKEDITEKKEITARLEESEKRFKKFANLAIEGILIHKKGVVIDANKSALKISGYKLGELIGKNIIQLAIPKKYHSIITKNLSKEYITPFELELKNKNGNIIPIKIRAFVINYKGEEVKVTIFRDITEKKETERRIMNAIISTEERDKRKFAEELHDGLGPILSTINLYIEALKITEDTNKIKTAVNRIGNSIDEAIKSVQEISNNMSPHILENFGLVTALQSFCKKIEELNEIKIECFQNLEVRLKKEIEINLYRVITELVNNSLKHSKAKKINLQLKHQDTKIFIIYTDNGIGFDITKEKKKHKGMGILNINTRIKHLGGDVIFSNNNNNKGMKCKISIDI